MKKSTTYLVIIMFSLFGTYFQAQAQGHYEVNPENVNHQSGQIYDDFEDQIGILPQTITSFLQELSRPDTYNPNMSNAALQVTERTVDAISLDWAPQEGAISYELSFLNLNNGENETISLAGANSSWSWDQLEEEDLYMLSLTSFYDSREGEQTSFVEIIIIEEKVFYVLPGASGIQCHCRGGDEIVRIENPNGLSNAEISWNPYPGKSYSMAIEYMDESINSYLKFVAYKNFSGEGVKARFTNFCLGNLWPNPGNGAVVYGYNETNPLTIQLFYVNNYFNWSLNHSEPIIKSVVLTGCPGQVSTPGFNREQLEAEEDHLIFPNPAFDYVEVVLKKEFANALSEIEIFDQSGKLWLRQETTATKERLDVSEFPSGIYQVKINSEQKRKVKRFIKMN